MSENLTTNISRLFDSGESADDPQSAVALEMESAERRSEPDLLVYGGAILLILLVVSVLLFYVDKGATEKIDDYLYNYYGGNEYERLTTLYNPESEETFLQESNSRLSLLDDLEEIDDIQV
ncbi:uncharacterized protein LOC111701352 [Eurytemora carolleeae]|uniref:uncharacterized protein LOC111701352 n=1 Tax=Eurytemora carolleeae TaxID=1294199 RepID=UPI000C778595|nr:uncharacterized protein LOC111701352 [Eurytemora carolleeae]|eukprot:XP_023328370.1 uncharacterized protein LOC111701352 [Eurytemora affinis]